MGGRARAYSNELSEISLVTRAAHDPQCTCFAVQPLGQALTYDAGPARARPSRGRDASSRAENRTSF